MNNLVNKDLSFSSKLKKLSLTTSILLESLILLRYLIHLRDIDKSSAICFQLHNRK